MKQALSVLAVLCCLHAIPALAFERSQLVVPETEERDLLLEQRRDDLVRTLRRALQILPDYAPPELNERGDIVIRRREPVESRPSGRPPRWPHRDDIGI